MVKRQKRNTTKKPISKADKNISLEARKINASTHYETCSEQLSPFGGALALIKVLDLLKFEEILTCKVPKSSLDILQYLLQQDYLNCLLAYSY